MHLWQLMRLRGTTAAVTIYLLGFIAVLKTNELPSLPQPNNQHGLNLSIAWQDLHAIAARPHPFNSHANDLVHAYLLERLNPIAAAYSHVHVVDDRVSNASDEQSYFEGSNILVKVDGTAQDLHDAVLFSAHYDSVSTASGATDDGMAIVSMLQMVEKLAKTRGKRTAIFNFNNGEEDGLNGARVFLEHPWSNLTGTFLNLEGAGFGSRPILFRGTSTKPLRAFYHVPHPHGTILAADAFSAGVIRSRTDYSVYAQGGGMQGLDFAFYRGRSYYHTKYDAIPFIQGGVRALWGMMETLDAAGCALLDQDNSEPSEDVVYFDLFGQLMVMFPLATMQTFNIILLVTVPVVTTGFFVWRHLAVTRGSRAGILYRVWWGKGKPKFDWIRFWIGLVVVVTSQAGLALLHLKSNKYVVYSSPYVVIGSAIFLAYLIFSLFVTSSLAFLRGHPLSTSSSQTLLLQLLVLYYLILLVTTLFVPIGGTYLFTAFAACAFLGWLVGSVDGVLNNHDQEHQNETSTTDEPREDQQPIESTPLIPRFSSGNNTEGDGHQMVIWHIQLLLVVPIPVILVSHIGVIILGSMPQGIVDGGPVWIVYAGLSLIATLLILPLVPFIPSYPRAVALPPACSFQHANSPKTLFQVVSVAFVISVAYTSGLLGMLLSPTSIPSTRHGFPFSIDSPMKVFFQQKVEIIAPWLTQEVDDTTSVKFETRSTTYLTGLPYYLKMIVPALPSAVNNRVECIGDNDRKELVRCSWSSGDNILPSPGKNISFYGNSAGIAQHARVLTRNPWLQSSIQILSSNTRRIWIQGSNTRACRVYFDNAEVDKWSVVDGRSGVQQGYEGYETKRGEGTKELRVWSRTWDREFVIDVSFVEPPQKIRGRVACGWSEYESGRVGLNDGIESKIPAYEEALRFLPRWATLTKLTDGLVEVWSTFEV
ncbi:hypothetical protein E4T56_gene19613 [Termitomyces sp. T112]|nr:hypothetical protein E4T56_gene19613 [Termitomyces sp. T112]